MKLAIVHDWLTGMRGGERVLEALCTHYPDAELFTLIHVRGSVAPVVERRRIHTSLAQRFPAVRPTTANACRSIRRSSNSSTSSGSTS